jgi:ABC-type Fe3+/spermidine/putrescine transport system ATPase subunit
LTKTYGARQVVRGVDLCIEAGSVIGLLGPNGAGKTTTFYMVVGLAQPDGGQVFIGEDEITGLPMYQRARKGISYLPQEASVFRKLTVADNLLAIVDHNKYQQTGPIARVMSLAPFAEKWRAFGWEVAECDGHDIADILTAIRQMKGVTGRPQVIIAHTVKGKGVSFIEKDFSFHGRSLSPEQDARARAEIAGRDE